MYTLATFQVMSGSAEQTKQYDTGVKENSSFVNRKCMF